MNDAAARLLPIAVAVDTAIVVAFVAIGRRNHDRDDAVAGLVSTAAPFLIALAIAWLVWRVWVRPTSIASGVEVWLTTLALGMVLRRFVFDDGTAASFVVVAAVFLSLLLDWRLVTHLVRRRRADDTAEHSAPTATPS